MESRRVIFWRTALSIGSEGKDESPRITMYLTSFLQGQFGINGLFLNKFVWSNFCGGDQGKDYTWHIQVP